MSTSAISGKTGTVTNANGASEVVSWDATLTVALNEATSMDSSGWAEFVAGIEGGTGSLTGQGTTPTTGSTSALTLANSAGTIKISGDAFLSSITITNDTAANLEWSADFSFTGEVSVTV